MARIPHDLHRKRMGHSGIDRQLRILDTAIEYGRRLERLYPERMRNLLLKQEENFTVYENAESRLRRNDKNDRQFPLETVMLQSHNRKHDTDLSNATIHIGMSADEYARSFHALAITIGTNIY